MARIVIVIKQPGFLRYIQTQIEKLCQGGHNIHIGIQDRPIIDEDGLLADFHSRFGNLSVGWAPHRTDVWARLAGPIRGALDYCHYLFPEFTDSWGLRRRYHKQAGTLGRLLARCARTLRIDRSQAAVGFFLSLLHSMHKALPPDPNVVSYLHQLDADLVLVTGLVWPRSPQVDMIETCRRLGIPTGYIVNSWDNLTNKGDVKSVPDRIFVWNEDQAQEATRLHGIPKSAVVVTGAPLFDRWFVRVPGKSREVFLKSLRLSLDRAFILYVCSSPTIAPGTSERKFFSDWLSALRALPERRIANAQVVVRPHPFNHTAWSDFEEPGVTVFPKAGGWIVSEHDRDSYFDSLYYCDVVVGINTSAMIESAIVGAKTFTIQTGAFADMQEGTAHFHYLTGRGIVVSHTHFSDHFQAVAAALGEQHGPSRRAPIAGVIDFVRPHGLEIETTPIAVAAILDLAANPTKKRTPVLSILCWRPIMYAALPVSWAAERLRRWREKRADRRLKGRWHTAFQFLLRMLRWVGLQDRFEERALPQLVKLGTEALRTHADLLQLSLTDRRDHRRLKYARDHINSALRGRKPIIVGPWISEIGFEVLYWIPFLRWFAEHYRVDPERIVAVSRGGTHAWYEGLASRYADVFDMLTPEEFRRQNEMRIRDLGHQKQSKPTEFEKVICEKAARILGLQSYTNLHPSVMFRLFARYWKGYSGFEFIDIFTRYRSLRPAFDVEESQVRRSFPERYAAVKFYFRESLPDTPENRAAISRIIERLSRHIDVVLLDTGLCIDDHTDCDLSTRREGIHKIERWLKPSNNLHIQTEVIAGARLFIGTYGGMTYVASLLGVPAICFESHPELNLSVHTELAMRKLKPLGGSFHLVNVNDMEFWSWLADTNRGNEIS